MRKALGILYILLSVLGILINIGLTIGLAIYLGSVLRDANMSIDFIFENFNNPAYAEVIPFLVLSVISFVVSVVVGLVLQIVGIILGALALGKKMSDKAVAIAAIIFGAIGGGIVILILGIVFMVKIDEVKKKEILAQSQTTLQI